jgi:hypothetical protein
LISSTAKVPGNLLRDQVEATHADQVKAILVVQGETILANQIEAIFANQVETILANQIGVQPLLLVTRAGARRMPGTKLGTLRTLEETHHNNAAAASG